MWQTAWESSVDWLINWLVELWEHISNDYLHHVTSESRDERDTVSNEYFMSVLSWEAGVIKNIFKYIFWEKKNNKYIYFIKKIIIISIFKYI